MEENPKQPALHFLRLLFAHGDLIVGPDVTGCRKLLVELSNYLDGELDPALRRELELHLKACPECWVLLDTTRKAIQIFRGSEPYPMPEDVKSRLAEALRRKRAQRGPQA